MKDTLGLFIITKRRLFWIYQQKLNLSPYTQETDKFLPLKCLRYNKNISTELMQDLFCVRQTHYNLRNPHNFAVLSINFVYHGSESISNLGPRIWNLVPYRLKELNRISSLKNEIRRQQPEICRGSLCKTYIPRVDFL